MQRFVDGQWLDADSTSVSRGMSESRQRRSVFTTMAIQASRPVFLREHLFRLQRDLTAIHIRPVAEDLICEALVSGLRRNDLRDGLVRIVVAPGDDQADGSDDASCLSLLFESPRPHPGPVTLMLAELPASAQCSIKQVWRGDWEKAAEPALAAGCFDVLATCEGQLLETSICNVFVVIGEELATPPADGRILPGIAREQLLAADDLNTSEVPVRVAELESAQAVFITNCVRGVIPVRQIVGADQIEVWSSEAQNAADVERAAACWRRLVEREIDGNDRGFDQLYP